MTIITVFLHCILLSCCTGFQGADTVSDTTCVGYIGRIPATFDVALKNISSFSGLYLNTNSTSTCNGTVIAWNYCYYVNIQGTKPQMTKIQAGVWRRQGTGYQLLNNSLADIPIPLLDSGLQFVCREWYLDIDKTFQVQKGDIVGLHAENKSLVIHFLGMPTSNEQDNGTWEVKRIADATSPVLANDSELIDINYSLYLMAVIGNFSEKVLDRDETTTGMPTSNEQDNGTVLANDSELIFTNYSLYLIAVIEKVLDRDETTTELQLYYFIMAGLGAFILLLLVIITTIVCKLCCIRIRRKETGPVLIRYANGRVNWTIPVLQNPARCDSIENSSDGTQTPLDQPSHQHTIPSPVVMATSPLQPEPHEATSPNMSPLPAVFTVVFDDKQMTDDQDKVLVDPRFQHATNKKISLISPSLPKSDIKRSHSENEALKLLHTNGTDDHEASTEYPYVLHAFEVIGKQRASVGSVPKTLEHHTPLKNSHSLDKLNLESNKQGHPDAVGYMNLVEGTHYNTESIDDLSYSYVDNNTLVQGATRMLPAKRYDQHDNHTSQNCDEYPLAWTPALQSALGFMNPTTKSNGEVLIDQVTQTQSDTQTNENFQLQQSSMKCSNPLQLGAEAENGHVSVDNVTCSAQSSHKHMKLLESTKVDHKCTSLQRSDTELSENDLDSERAHPEEWCKHAPH